MSDQGKTVKIPMKMAISIAQNPDAVRAFGKLSEAELTALISRAKGACSNDEISKIVGEIAAMR